MEDGKVENAAEAGDAAETLPVVLRILGPLPCVKCLYDLNGLGQDQKCPECGTEAARTLGSLATASVDDLERIRTALLYIGLAMTAGPAAVVVAIWGAGMVASSFMVANSLAGRIGEFAPFLVLMFAATGPVLSSIGWRRLEVVRLATAPDPFAAPAPKSIYQSNLLRRLAVIFALMFLTAPIVAFIMLNSGEALGGSLGVGSIGGMYICWALRMYLGLGALGELRRRLTTDAGLRVLGTFRLLILIVTCVVVSAIATFAVQPSVGLRFVMAIHLCLLSAAALAMTCGVWALLLRRRATTFLIPAVARSQQAAGSA